MMERDMDDHYPGIENVKPEDRNGYRLGWVAALEYTATVLTRRAETIRTQENGVAVAKGTQGKTRFMCEIDGQLCGVKHVTEEAASNHMNGMRKQGKVRSI